MKNKLVFRILGALASALIITSIFIPFVSVTGYSQSLWQTHSAIGTIYLPIMILVFGIIGVLVFSTGFKTELAYASAGGLLFFIITQTVPVLNQNLFNTFGVGYYCLVIGTLLVIIMAFLCSLKVKKKIENEEVVDKPKELNETTMLDQIDKLYNDQTDNQVLSQSNNLDEIIQPLPIAPISSSDFNNEVVNISVPLENNIQQVVQPQDNIDTSIGNVNSQEIPIVEQDLPIMDNSVNISQETTTLSNVENPVLSEFNNSTENTTSNNNLSNNSIEVQNPVIAEFSSNLEINKPIEQNAGLSNSNGFFAQNQENSSVQNPVIAEFNSNLEINKSIEQNVELSNSNESFTQNQENNNVQNPVIAEFSNSLPQVPSFLSTNNDQTQQVNIDHQQQSNEVSTDEIIKPLDSDKKIDVMSEPINNSSNLDIFG